MRNPSYATDNSPNSSILPPVQTSNSSPVSELDATTSIDWLS